MAKRGGTIVKKRTSVPAGAQQAARPMKVIVDDSGCPWLCDAKANPREDLKSQGCWRCSDVTITTDDRSGTRQRAHAPAPAHHRVTRRVR